MTDGKLKKGNSVLYLASYCDDDDPTCTDDMPCLECLKMSNVAVLKEDCAAEIRGGYEYLRGVAT